MSTFASAARPSRYESLFELEQRGCARSYLAIDHGTPAGARLVVVHVVPRSLSRDPDFVPLFGARAGALLSVTHPNLVRTLDFVAKEGQRCQWVSEFIQGHTLGSLLAKRKGAGRALTLRQHLTILCDVLRGLEHAHRVADAAGTPNPIVYRHLSASSVLVSYDGTVKVTDAALCSVPSITSGRFDGEVERLAYRAPECCLGGKGDPRSDVFAVGALLWEAVYQRPRPVGSSIEAALEMCRSAAEPEFDADSGVSPTLSAITRRALARDPSERYQSARELRLGIEAQMPPVSESRDRAALFAFMCSHFYEEHEALQRLLESRAPSVLDPARAREADAHGHDRADVGADTDSGIVPQSHVRALSAQPPRADSSNGEDVRNASVSERGMGSGGEAPAGVGSSRFGRRVRRGVAALSLAGGTIFAFFMVRPDLGSQRATQSVVQHLRSPSPSAQAPVVTPAPPSAPVPPPSPAVPAPATGVTPAVTPGAIPEPARALIPAVIPRASTPAPAPVPPITVAPAVPVSPAPRPSAAAASDPGVRARSGAAESDPLVPATAATPPRAGTGAELEPAPRSRTEPTPRSEAEPAPRSEAEPTPPPRAESTPPPAAERDRGAGVDLRSLRRRAPRPIDEVNPYGP
jgi:serine/threonine protein kinase